MAMSKVYGQAPKAIEFKCDGYGCVAYDPTSAESKSRAEAELARQRELIKIIEQYSGLRSGKKVK